MTYPQNPQPGPPPYPMPQNPAGAQPYYPVPTSLPAPESTGLSLTSMVLALVSVVFGFTFLIPIAALILGIVGLRREPAGRGMALAGVIVSGLILVVWGILLAVVLVVGFSLFGVAVSQTA